MIKIGWIKKKLPNLNPSKQLNEPNQPVKGCKEKGDKKVYYLATLILRMSPKSMKRKPVKKQNGEKSNLRGEKNLKANSTGSELEHLKVINIDHATIKATSIHEFCRKYVF